MSSPSVTVEFLVVPPSAFRRNPWFGKLLGYGRPEGGRHA